METLTCEFCKKLFSSKSNLTAHTNKAKYCISKRTSPSTSTIEYNCEFCSKSFTSNQFLTTHRIKCNDRLLKEQQTFYEKKLQEQKMLLQEKDNSNLILQKQIENLQNKIVSIALGTYVDWKNRH
jgi:hypothetical protein